MFAAALILMLNIWNERRSQRAISGVARDLALVQKCVDMLRALQNEWVQTRISHCTAR